jgi:hypothetical protein
MVMLQVCFDDSGRLDQGRTSWIAGYAARTEVWEGFSDRWDAALKSPPSIQYFKMTDAYALAREFEGWTTEARNKKVHALIDVITQTEILYGIAVALHNADYLGIAKDTIGMPFNDQFYFLFQSAIQQTFVYQFTAGITERVDFIFDESNKQLDEVMAVWLHLMAVAPPKLHNLVNGPPMFRDDKKFMPLQAADLLAGQMRNYYCREPGDRIASAGLRRLADGTHLMVSEYDAKVLIPFVSDVKFMQTLSAEQKAAFLMQSLVDSAKRLNDARGLE